MEFLLKSKTFVKFMLLACLGIPATGLALIMGGGATPVVPESELRQESIDHFPNSELGGQKLELISNNYEHWLYLADAPQFAKVKTLLQSHDRSIVLWATPKGDAYEIYAVSAGGHKVVTYAENAQYHRNQSSHVFLGVVLLLFGIGYIGMMVYTFIIRGERLFGR